MVPHPHGHPGHPLPYFAPFHIPPPSEFTSNVELTPLTTYTEQQPQQQAANTAVQFQPPQEDQPKVVVPNIEEELNFLAEGTVRRPANHNNHKTNASAPLNVGATLGKPNVTDKAASGLGASFMSSYLKFLQGKRDDTSPPPMSRGGRKQNWTRPSSAGEGGAPSGQTNGVITGNLFIQDVS